MRYSPVSFALLLVASAIQYRSVQALGSFVTPSGADGSNSYTVGQPLNIQWQNTENYTILSLGYKSSSNETITWLIGNSMKVPQYEAFTWTVNPEAAGFRLTSSSLFKFVICNDTNFGALFTSPWFNVQRAALSSTSTMSSATASASASSTASTTPNNNDTNSNSGISTGAKVGIGVGVAGAVIGAVVITWLLISRRRAAKQVLQPNQKIYEQQQQQFYPPQLYYGPPNPPPQELPTISDPTELDADALPRR